MSEHTRGPWFIHINDSPVSLTGRIEVTTDAGIVCLIHPWENPVDLADARLIAAAPEMLAALKLLLDASCEQDDCTASTYRRAADAASVAIAKAEGKS